MDRVVVDVNDQETIDRYKIMSSQGMWVIGIRCIYSSTYSVNQLAPLFSYMQILNWSRSIPSYQHVSIMR